MYIGGSRERGGGGVMGVATPFQISKIKESNKTTEGPLGPIKK